MKDSPLFAKSYDFVRWLIPQTVKFPREQRFVVAQRLQSAALDFMEHLYRATDKTAQASDALRQADVKLKLLRFYLRLSHDLQLLDTRRYEHACRLLEELGRLLGAWIRKLE
ncbi:MAG: diversity-generating retroelement protein Avd [Gammaproteobacteria bacterium]